MLNAIQYMQNNSIKTKKLMLKAAEMLSASESPYFCVGKQKKKKTAKRTAILDMRIG